MEKDWTIRACFQCLKQKFLCSFEVSRDHLDLGERGHRSTWLEFQGSRCILPRQIKIPLRHVRFSGGREELRRHLLKFLGRFKVFNCTVSVPAKGIQAGNIVLRQRAGIGFGIDLVQQLQRLASIILLQAECVRQDRIIILRVICAGDLQPLLRVTCLP